MHQKPQTTNALKSSVRVLFNWEAWNWKYFHRKTIIFQITLHTSFLFLDGNFFSTFNGYYCKSTYQTERGIANATSKCKEDANCAMVSTLECTDGDSLYGLCNKSTELIPKLEACTLWKIGTEMTFKISYIY